MVWVPWVSTSAKATNKTNNNIKHKTQTNQTKPKQEKNETLRVSSFFLFCPFVCLSVCPVSVCLSVCLFLAAHAGLLTVSSLGSSFLHNVHLYSSFLNRKKTCGAMCRRRRRRRPNITQHHIRLFPFFRQQCQNQKLEINKNLFTFVLLSLFQQVS